MLTLFICLLIGGIIALLISLFSITKVKNFGTRIFCVVLLYIGGLVSGIGFWGLILYLAINTMKDVL